MISFLGIFLLSIATVQQQFPFASAFDGRLSRQIPTVWKDESCFRKSLSVSVPTTHSAHYCRRHTLYSAMNRKVMMILRASAFSSSGDEWDEEQQQQSLSNSTKTSTSSLDRTRNNKGLLSRLFFPFRKKRQSLEEQTRRNRKVSIISSERQRKTPMENTNASLTDPNEPLRGKRRSGRKRELSRNKKRNHGMLLKRLVQFLSLAAAILIVTPFVSGELNSFQQPISYEREYAPLQAASDKETSSTLVQGVQKESDGAVSGSTDTKGETAKKDMARVDERKEPKGLLGNKSRENSKERHQLLRQKREDKTSSFFGSEPRLSAQERKTMALSFVTEAVQKVAPSVVRIDTETHFLNQEGENGAMPPRAPGFVQQGQGSGVIFSRDGLILTNAHVIEDANRVTITMTDGRLYEAEVRGADEIVDIAVVKIIPPEDETLNLPVASFGDSDTLTVGRIVIAVGSAGGLDGSVTMGIVSGLERSSTVVGIPHKKVDYIQTDASINPGNSGGPLVDVETGDVIGINAAIRAHMEGTSFSIPINRVREIMYDLADGKEVQHGYLGVSLATCTPEWARRTNAKASSDASKIPEVQGVLVHKVFPRTPADRGGVQGGDIVIQINGQTVQTSDQARRLIDRAPVGETLTLTVLRDKQTMEFDVVPVDLATRLKEIRRERMQQIQQERLRYQELGPFPMER